MRSGVAFLGATADAVPAQAGPLSAAPKAIVKNPVAVYVEKIHEEGDLLALGIGT